MNYSVNRLPTFCWVSSLVIMITCTGWSQGNSGSNGSTVAGGRLGGFSAQSGRLQGFTAGRAPFSGYGSARSPVATPISSPGKKPGSPGRRPGRHPSAFIYPGGYYSGDGYYHYHDDGRHHHHHHHGEGVTSEQAEAPRAQSKAQNTENATSDENTDADESDSDVITRVIDRVPRGHTGPIQKTIRQRRIISGPNRGKWEVIVTIHALAEGPEVPEFKSSDNTEYSKPRTDTHTDNSEIKPSPSENNTDPAQPEDES